MIQYNLFMILLGCRPKGRNTEQHDVFFGIARQLRDLVPEINNFWKGAAPIHIDGWRIINHVDGFSIRVVEKERHTQASSSKLFFLNLGGYKAGCFEEFHYKMLTVAANPIEAAKNAKETAFFLHTGLGKKGAAHIDDRFGVDVDDLFDIKDILPADAREKFSVTVVNNTGTATLPEDEIHIGYFKLHEL